MGIAELIPKRGIIESSRIKKKTKRDSRRSFTKTQKNAILAQQNNKCARCHETLDARAIEFHHGKAWVDGGKTIIKNGKALCADCHSIVTNQERLKKQETAR